MNGLIYIIKNTLNNKVYIGQTTQPIEGRWKDHKVKSKTYNFKLYKAIRELGLENFYIEELESNLDKDILTERENYWILYYNSIQNGYNMIEAGDIVNRRSVYKIDPKTNEILESYDSVTAAGVANNLNPSGISSVCLRKLYSLGNFKWCYSNEYDKNYLSSLNIRPNFRPVYQLDLQGNIIKKWSHIGDIVNTFGYSQASISNCCNKKQKTAYGFNWCFVENYDNYKPMVSTKRIRQIDKNNNTLIKIWDNANDIIIFLQKGNKSNIYACCRGKQKTAYGYKWEYEREE